MLRFRDHALLELASPAAFGPVLLPAGDADRALIRTMLAATYDLSAARVERVQDVVVQEVELQRPLFAADRTTGTWTQTVPGYTRSEVDLEAAKAHTVTWIDLLARLRVTVVTELDAAGAESVVTESIDGFTTLDDFRQRVPFIDLDAFMAEHGISTVEELREAFQYLISTVRLRAAAPFDPDDPANTHTLDVVLAAVVAESFDLVEGLRATRLIRARSRTGIGAAPALPVEHLAPYATAVILPDELAELAGAGTTTAAVTQLFARAGVAALFLPPPE